MASLLTVFGVVFSLQDTSRAAMLHYAREAWDHSGRSQIVALSGLVRDSSTGEWSVRPNWDGAQDAGAKAYYLEPVLRGALGLAEATGDTALLQDVARFYTSYQARFTTVGAILAAEARVGPAPAAKPQGDAKARTLAWLDRGAREIRPAECTLCNAQAFHPAARLVRLIALLPPQQVTPAMAEFVRAYVPFLISEHLIRLGYQTQWEARLPSARFMALVPYWEVSTSGPAKGKYRMRDTDLWLMASAGELLEANRLRPSLVPLLGEEVRLHRLVESGMKFLRSLATAHPAVLNTAGVRVGALDLFEGDFDNLPDAAYGGYVDSTAPSALVKRPARRASWDISHIQRVPTALRSLWDARKAIGSTAPDSQFLAQVVNQYLYVARRGDWRRPSFSNFFDGQDGWFRVGYAGRGDWGYAPSPYCDNRLQGRPCLGRWGIAGWGLLAFVNPDLLRLQGGILAVAASSPSDTVDDGFRRRVYAVSDDDFSLRSSRVSPLLAEVIGEYASGMSVSAAAVRPAVRQ